MREVEKEKRDQGIQGPEITPEIEEITYYANNEMCQKELRISLSYHDWCLFEKQQCYQDLKKIVQELKTR